VAAALGAATAAALLFVTTPGNALLGATAAAFIGVIGGGQPEGRGAPR
jgi:hypothetical protein